MAGPKFPTLAQPGNLGALKLNNRVLMASLTRNRSVPTNIANELNEEYYSQRARPTGAGLIFTEGTLIAQQGTEWPHVPGIWTDEQAAGWKKSVDAVHKQGTQIVAQLWHVGRVSHPDMDEQKKAGSPVYAPSAVAARGGKFRALPGQPGYVTPTAVPDPTLILDQYTNAAQKAKLAGFDGVELHSANGYLVEQFLSDKSNVRDDKWGGSVENRTRFGLEAVKRLIDVWGADRVGIKLSPAGGYNDMYYSSPEALTETFKYYISELDKLGLAYMQITGYNSYGDPKHDGVPQGYDHDIYGTYLPLVKNTKVLANYAFQPDTAEEFVKSGKAEAVTFGQYFIANPDFYKRAQEGLGYNEPNVKLFYQDQDGDNSAGYTDYPFA